MLRAIFDAAILANKRAGKENWNEKSEDLGRTAAARVSDPAGVQRPDGHQPQNGAADVPGGSAARPQGGAAAVADRQERRAGMAEANRKARRCWNTDEPCRVID